jgi:hypothetical protein
VGVRKEYAGRPSGPLTCHESHANLNLLLRDDATDRGALRVALRAGTDEVYGVGDGIEEDDAALRSQDCEWMLVRGRILPGAWECRLHFLEEARSLPSRRTAVKVRRNPAPQ